MNHKYNDKPISERAFPFLLAEICNVAELSDSQLSNISHSMNLPVSEINDIFDQAELEANQLKTSPVFVNFNREKLHMYADECRLGYVEGWDDPEQMSDNLHPILILVSGQVHHAVVHVDFTYKNDVEISRPQAISLDQRNEFPMALTTNKEILISKINDYDFDGYSEFKVGDIPVCLLMVDYKRFVQSAPNHDNLFGDNKYQGAINFTYEISEFISPHSTQDELKDIFSVLVSTALMVDWCSETSLNEIALHSQSLKCQLSHLMCLIVGESERNSSEDPLFLMDDGYDQIKILNYSDIDVCDGISVLLSKRLKKADLFEWNTIPVSKTEPRVLRIR